MAGVSGGVPLKKRIARRLVWIAERLEEAR